MTAAYIKNANNFGVYNSSITTEQFLFYEMRTTAKLMSQGFSDKEILSQIVSDNLFQYPTEKSIQRMTTICLSRLKAMGDSDLVNAIATQSSDVAKQICLYAMMKRSYLVWDFMITVIGEKYRVKDSSFGMKDINVYFMHLQEQNDTVASWKDSTITRIKLVLMKILVENEYVDDATSTQLNTVWINPILESAIKNNNDSVALAAFNCFYLGN